MTDSAKTPILYSLKEIINKYDTDKTLNNYIELLKEENKKVNLVSRETIKDGMIGLCVESYLPFEKVDLPEQLNYLDIGSGGGLPAIPILLSLSGKIKRAMLVERRGKKAAVLRRILNNLSIKADISTLSFEEIKFDQKFDFITLKLVKLTPKILKKALSILSTNGKLIYYSTPELELVNNNYKYSFITHYYTMDKAKSPKSFTIIKKNNKL